MTYQVGQPFRPLEICGLNSVNLKNINLLEFRPSVVLPIIALLVL